MRSRAQTVSIGMLATGKHRYCRFAARSTTLPYVPLLRIAGSDTNVSGK